MLRSDAATLVALDLSAVLTAANMQGTDTTGNLKEPLDRALRAMGVAESDLATAAPDDGALFEAQAQYETLRTISRRLGDQMSLGTGGDNFQLNQVFTNVQTLLKEAADRVKALGGSPGGSGIAVGVWDTGFAAVVADDEYGA